VCSLISGAYGAGAAPVKRQRAADD